MGKKGKCDAVLRCRWEWKGQQLLLGEQAADVVALDWWLPRWKRARQYVKLCNISHFQFFLLQCSISWLEGLLAGQWASPIGEAFQHFFFMLPVWFCIPSMARLKHAVEKSQTNVGEARSRQHQASLFNISNSWCPGLPMLPILRNFRIFSERALRCSASTLSLLTSSTLSAITANSVRIVTRHQISKKSTTLNGTFETQQKGILANFEPHNVPFPSTK